MDFVKMHALGNDFVIIDFRQQPLDASMLKDDDKRVQRLSDRKTGIGCDQLVVLEGGDDLSSVRMAIYNPDGSQARACGNATRCVAGLLIPSIGDSLIVKTIAADLPCVLDSPHCVRVEMGPPGLHWDQIPLSEDVSTLDLCGLISSGPLKNGCAVNVGNPHVVFFVTDVSFVDIEQHGAALERHPLLPDRANISAVQILSADLIRLRVWERGAGHTRACGTAACAAVVAATRRSLLPSRHRVRVDMEGGALDVIFDGVSVTMIGEFSFSFSGRISSQLWG